MASASVNTPAFSRLWETDAIREKVLANVDKQSLINLRLVCRGFAKRTTIPVFRNVTITFRSTTFTKPARMAALRRIGPYVRRLTFSMPYCMDTLLPPLIEPSTGTEIEFIYTPDCEMRKPESSHSRLIGQDDASKALSDVLIKQYPPLYHAAVNVPSFIKAFACMPNIKYLAVTCPSEDSVVPTSQSIVDYAMISLRIGIERNNMNKLEHLTLAPIQPHIIKLLNPVFGPGARPDSLRRWRQIKNLTIHMPMTTALTQLKQLHNYLNALSPNLQSFKFHWLAPIARPSARNSFTYSGKPIRPISTGTSYFPSQQGPQVPHRGANPLTLHMSSFLQLKSPREKASAHSLPSMTSASTLRSTSSSRSSHSARSSPSTSPTRRQREPREQHAQRPNLRCQTNCRRPSTSSSSSSSASSPSGSPRPSPSTGLRPIDFPKLSFFELDSISCKASEIAAFISSHGAHLSEFRLEHTTLEPGGGDWDDALAPLTALTGGDERWKDQNRGQAPSNGTASRPSGQPSREKQRVEEEVPICLAPELASPMGFGSPLSPFSPLSPLSPFSPLSPLSPLRSPVAVLPMGNVLENVLAAEPRIVEIGPGVDIGAEIGMSDVDEDHVADMIAPTPMLFGDELPLPPPLPMMTTTTKAKTMISIAPPVKGLAPPSLAVLNLAASPLLAMKAGMGRPHTVLPGFHGGGTFDRAHGGAGACKLGRGVKMGARLLTTATTQRSPQKDLEDGVRKLLAQTVFPWF